MKTYAAKKGKPEVNWTQILKNLSRRKTELPEEEFERISHLAQDWKSCACGQLSELLERDEEKDGEIVDEELRGLGLAFYDCVDDQNWAEARYFLAEIKRIGGEMTKKLEQNAFDTLRSLGYNVAIQ